MDTDTASERSESRNDNVRRKRSRDEDDHKELKSLISALSAKVDRNFLDLKQKNEELKESLQFISDKYDSILKTLSNLESDRVENRKIMQKLEEKVEILERKSKSTSLEIRNIPISISNHGRFETKEEACKIVKNLSKAVEVEISDFDIKDIYKVTTHKEGHKPVIVEFNSVLKKDKIIQAIKRFNYKKPIHEKLNTEHLAVPGPAKPVFISEVLTPKTQKLFYAARQFARDNEYSYCWTSRGLIYLRKAEGEPPIRIETEASLAKLTGKK